MMRTESNETQSVRLVLSRLAEALLQYYHVTQPPVPIERMLREPPSGLAEVDPSQISTVADYGLYCYASRLAMARLLCREITWNGVVQATFGTDIPSLSLADMKFFSRCLLMPGHWVRKLAEQGLSVDEIGAYLQVPSYAVVTRMAELGLPMSS